MARLVGHLAALLLGAALVPAVASCVSMLGVDDYRGAVGDLCALLGDCYGPSSFPGCDEWLGHAIERAEPASRHAWLAQFGVPGGCLRNCTRGKQCLDQAPVCRAPGAVCFQKEQCCGFTRGEGTCGAPGDAALGLCCLPDGLPCTTDPECCHGDCSTLTYTCAGKLCVHQGGQCTYDTDCCSLNCSEDGACLAECLPLRESCSSLDECCSRVCEAALCACHADGELCADSRECCAAYCDPSGHCAEANICANGGEACGALDCCEGFDCGNALQFPVCCLPNGQTCSGADQCCNLGCTSGACCNASGVACVDAVDCCFGTCTDHVCTCIGADAPCTQQQDCCESLACANDGSSNLCKPCIAASCHAVCDAGDPLSLSLPSCPELDGAQSCIQAICQVDAWCCCVGWDGQCQLEVSDNALVPGAPCWGLCG